MNAIYRDINGKQLSHWELIDRYNEALDGLAPQGDGVHIGHLVYAASEVLKAVDPVEYLAGFGDWLDSELAESLVEAS